MIWWTFLQSLSNHLAGAVPDAHIEFGDQPHTPTTKTIRIVRGPEDRWPVTKAKHDGLCEIHLYLWEHDPENPSSAYQKLNTLEQAVEQALRTWTVPGYTLADKTVQPQPDNDLYRPSVGVRFVVRVNWRRTEI